MSYCEWQTIEHPSARKEYRCCWCHETIERRARHVKATGKYEGDFFSSRWHDECRKAAEEMWDEDPDFELGYDVMMRGGKEPK